MRRKSIGIILCESDKQSCHPLTAFAHQVHRQFNLQQVMLTDSKNIGETLQTSPAGASRLMILGMLQWYSQFSRL
jgi:hypothetical protein